MNFWEVIGKNMQKVFMTMPPHLSKPTDLNAGESRESIDSPTPAVMTPPDPTNAGENEGEAEDFSRLPSHLARALQKKRAKERAFKRPAGLVTDEGVVYVAIPPGNVALKCNAVYKDGRVCSGRWQILGGKIGSYYERECPVCETRYRMIVDKDGEGRTLYQERRAQILNSIALAKGSKNIITLGKNIAEAYTFDQIYGTFYEPNSPRLVITECPVCRSQELKDDSKSHQEMLKCSNCAGSWSQVIDPRKGTLEE